MVQARADSNRWIEAFFAKSALGWASVGIVAILLILLAYTLFFVVPLLTQPPNFIDQSVKASLSNVTAIENPELYIAYLSTLEYESFCMRTQGIQISLGFLVGLFLAAFGMMLFAIGATGTVEASAEKNAVAVAIKSTTPGLAVLITSGIIIALAVTKNVQRKFEATYEKGGVPTVKTFPFTPPAISTADEKPQSDDQRVPANVGEKKSSKP